MIKSNFTAYPFYRLLLFLLCGVFCRFMLQSELSILVIVGLLLLCLLLIIFSFIFKGNYKFRWIKGVVFVVLFFIFGFLLKPLYQSKGCIFNEENIYKCEVTDVLKVLENRQTILLTCSTAVSNNTSFFKVIAYNTVDSVSDMLLPGDHVYINAAIQKFKKQTNPFVFDYGNYLSQSDVVGYLNLKQDNFILSESKFTLKRYLFLLKEFVMIKLSKLKLSQSGNAILTALILGDKSKLSNSIKSDYSKAGAIHVLAISGMHVGIVFLLLSAMLKGLDNFNLKGVKVLVILIVLWFYAFLTGLSPSVLRATIMFSVFVLAKYLNQSYQVYHAMAIAAFIILIVDPYSFINAGFWLSFLAVASIVYFYAQINKMAYFTKPWNKYLWSLVSVSLAVQIGTAPLVIYLFGFFPMWFLFSSILVVPLTPVILSCVIIILLLPEGGFIFRMFESFVCSCLNYCESCVRWISNFPHAYFVKIQFSVLQLIFFYSALLLIICWSLYKKIKFLHIGLLLFVVVVVLNLYDGYYKNSKEALIVYDLHGQSLIAKVKGNLKCDLYANSLSEDHHDFYISPLLSSYELQEEELHPLSEKGIIGLTVSTKNILLVNYKLRVTEFEGLIKNASVVVFTKEGYYQDLGEKMHLYKDKQFVFDASYSSSCARLLIKEFLKKNLKVHFVSLKGAFVYEQQLGFSKSIREAVY